MDCTFYVLNFALAISFGQFSFAVFSFVLLGTWQPPYYISSCFFLTGYNFPISFFFWHKHTRERLTNKPKNTFTVPDPSQLKLKIFKKRTKRAQENTVATECNHCGMEWFLSLEGFFCLVFSCKVGIAGDLLPCWFVGAR